jgi:hypothetical protein
MKHSVDRTDGGVVIVAFSGEVDWNTSPVVHNTLIPIFDERPGALVVDLSRGQGGLQDGRAGGPLSDL